MPAQNHGLTPRTGIERPGMTGQGERVTWLGMAINGLLVVLKLLVGRVAGSQSLIADGIHSASDLFTDFTTLLGIRWGRKAADADHPYGHGRIETISSMIVGVFLIVVGCFIAVEAVDTIITGAHITRPGVWALVVAAVSIVLKEALFWVTRAVARRLKSPVLMANAWHHRSDSLSSIAVLAGVGAAYVNPEWALADAVAALIVSLVVARMGVLLVWQALKELADTAPQAETVRRLTQVASGVEGVRDIHDVRSRLSGSQVFIEAHIVVDGDLSVRDGHEIAAEVRRRMHAALDDLAHVILHVDPDGEPDD